MTKKIDRTRALLRKGSVALALGTLPAWYALGCTARMDDGKSGETHFLCQKDDDCTKHFGNDDYACTGKTGDETYCAPKGDGGSPRGTGGQSGAGGGSGSSGGSSGKGATPDAGFDLSQCGTPPDSTCSSAETCTAVNCGPESMEYDEHACLRTACKTDGDCDHDDRCAVSECDAPSTCTIQAGTCQCATLDLCGSATRCNPVAQNGPRGDWVNLHIESGGFCAMPCTSIWDVGPDGHVTGMNGNRVIDTTFDQGTMFSLNQWVNGRELRVALRDGIPCLSETVTDVSLKMALTLSTGTLQKDATGCFGGDNVFANIYSLVSHL